MAKGTFITENVEYSLSQNLTIIHNEEKGEISVHTEDHNLSHKLNQIDFDMFKTKIIQDENISCSFMTRGHINICVLEFETTGVLKLLDISELNGIVYINQPHSIIIKINLPPTPQTTTITYATELRHRTGLQLIQQEPSNQMTRLTSIEYTKYFIMFCCIFGLLYILTFILRFK